MLKYTCCSFSTNKCIYQIGIGKSTFSHLVFFQLLFLGECVTFHRFYHAKINYYRIFFPVFFFSFWLEIIQSYFVSYFLKREKKSLYKLIVALTFISMRIAFFWFQCWNERYGIYLGLWSNKTFALEQVELVLKWRKFLELGCVPISYTYTTVKGKHSFLTL